MEATMNIRFIYNMLLTLAAGFLVVATQAFLPATVAWITFGIAVASVVLSASSFALRMGLVQRILSAVAFVIGAWTIVASLVFAPATVLWLGFASALALVGLGVVGLTAHELKTERVVHSLAVDRGPMVAERDREPIAA
jgi:hypothetical protein